MHAYQPLFVATSLPPTAPSHTIVLLSTLSGNLRPGPGPRHLRPRVRGQIRDAPMVTRVGIRRNCTNRLFDVRRLLVELRRIRELGQDSNDGQKHISCNYDKAGPGFRWGQPLALTPSADARKRMDSFPGLRYNRIVLNTGAMQRATDQSPRNLDKVITSRFTLQLPHAQCCTSLSDLRGLQGLHLRPLNRCRHVTSCALEFPQRRLEFVSCMFP